MIDLRAAIRSLRRSPGFVFTALATLALSIGANAAIFSLISAVLLEPLPYPQPDRLVQFWFSTPQNDSLTLSVPSLQAMSEGSGDVFSDVAGYDFAGPGVTIGGGAEPEQVAAIHASASYFRLLGARFATGRAFSEQEDRPNAGSFVLISHALWQRRFGKDAAVVGKPVWLGGEPYTVIGVLDAGFRTDPPAEVWFPLQADPASTNHAFYLRAIGRLRDGVTLEQANARLKLAYDGLRSRFPLLNAKASFLAKPMQETQAGDVRTALLVLLGMVLLVLLIACANLANLLMARATTREQEMAVRAAIGATRSQLTAQLLVETALLVLAGGLLGLACGHVLLEWLIRWNSDLLPAISTVKLDGRVLAFTSAVGIGVTLLAGLWPAWRSSSSVNLASAIQAGGGRTSQGRGALLAKSVLITAEVALAVVLVAGAALMARSFWELRHTNPGVETSRILTLHMSLQGTRYRNTADVHALVERGVERLRASSGVLAAASTWTLPVENCFSSTFIIEGRPLPGDEGVHGGTMMRPVSSDFANVFGIAVRRGRFFNERDTAHSAPVAVISEAMAKKYWPNSDPIGERLRLDPFYKEFATAPRMIIGVVSDVRDTGLRADPASLVYVPQSQVADGMTALDAKILPLTWVVKTAAANPYTMVRAARKELALASGGLAVGRVRSMEDVLRNDTSRSDFHTFLIAGFALLALLLAAIGVYGLMSYTVAQSTRELRIRLALGATPWQVQTLVIGQASRFTALGIVLGAGLSFWLARWLESLVFRVQPADPVSISLASLGIGAIALLAAFLAARSAAGLNALDALRGDMTR